MTDILRSIRNNVYETLGILTPMQKKAIMDPQGFHEDMRGDYADKGGDEFRRQLRKYYGAVNDLKLDVVLDGLFDSFEKGDFNPSDITRVIRKSNDVEPVEERRAMAYRFTDNLFYEGSALSKEMSKAMKLYLDGFSMCHDPTLRLREELD